MPPGDGVGRLACGRANKKHMQTQCGMRLQWRCGHYNIHSVILLVYRSPPLRSDLALVDHGGNLFSEAHGCLRRWYRKVGARRVALLIGSGVLSVRSDLYRDAVRLLRAVFLCRLPTLSAPQPASPTGERALPVSVCLISRRRPPVPQKEAQVLCASPRPP